MNDILDFYEAIGFEEIEIEDKLTALCCEIDESGSYVLLTDDNGAFPAALKQQVLFTLYSPEGSFQWSTSFKNADEFKELWQEATAPKEKLEAIRKYRDNKEWYK
jgi:predicted lactoylglutathione lyase